MLILTCQTGVSSLVVYLCQCVMDIQCSRFKEWLCSVISEYLYRLGDTPVFT